MDEAFKQAHAQRMQPVDGAGAPAQHGLVLLLTGNGKGKTTSAFGSLFRALGHGQRAGVVQFISGSQCTGEVTFLQQTGLLGQGAHSQVDYHAMATGLTRNREGWQSADKAAADSAWGQARRMLADASLQLVLLDELTFMLQYGYLAVDDVRQALQARPASQSVVITGRAAAPELIALADTVSEIADTRHALRAGVKAQPGVDF